MIFKLNFYDFSIQLIFGLLVCNDTNNNNHTILKFSPLRRVANPGRRLQPNQKVVSTPNSIRKPRAIKKDFTIDFLLNKLFTHP